MRSRVSLFTNSLPASARETVDFDTPAISARSDIFVILVVVVDLAMCQLTRYLLLNFLFIARHISRFAAGKLTYPNSLMVCHATGCCSFPTGCPLNTSTM